jgi:thioesterase domain-containing protein
VLVTPLELEQYLHRHIPLSRAMQVSVLEVQLQRVILAAPLEPNINHRDTVFGGSATAVAVLAGWSLVHVRLVHAGLASRLVIQRNTMTFSQPMAGAFTAQSSLVDAQWEKFMRTLMRRTRARISVLCQLYCAGEEAACFEGDFVALAM